MGIERRPLHSRQHPPFEHPPLSVLGEVLRSTGLGDDVIVRMVDGIHDFSRFALDPKRGGTGTEIGVTARGTDPEDLDVWLHMVWPSNMSVGSGKEIQGLDRVCERFTE